MAASSVSWDPKPRYISISRFKIGIQLLEGDFWFVNFKLVGTICKESQGSRKLVGKLHGASPAASILSWGPKPRLTSDSRFKHTGIQPLGGDFWFLNFKLAGTMCEGDLNSNLKAILGLFGTRSRD